MLDFASYYNSFCLLTFHNVAAIRPMPNRIDFICGLEVVTILKLMFVFT